MRIGFGAPVAGAWATPFSLATFAGRAEEAGYASLWTFQRLLVPEGSGMDPVYLSVLDPMVALGYAAAVTSRIRLGVAVLNLPFVSPAYLAKQATTVDVLSGGRLDLGLGIGWMPEEFTITGASTARRGARTEEFLAVLRTLWDDGVSSFDGEFYTVPAGRQDPRPVQRPGPPVLLGGMSRAAMERAGRFADGWITSSRADLSAIGEAVAVIGEAASAAGRDPEAVRIVCRGVVQPGTEAKGPDGGRRLLSGSYAQIREDTAWLGSQGVTEVFYDLNWDPQIGSPSVSPESAAERAGEILDELAPARKLSPRWSAAGWLGDQALAVGNGGGFRAAGGAQLAQDVRDVHAGGLRRDVQDGGDLAVAAARGDEPEHLAFPAGQRREDRALRLVIGQRPDPGPAGQVL
jgi:probable F420-dependent oxidoreductase